MAELPPIDLKSRRGPVLVSGKPEFRVEHHEVELTVVKGRGRHKREELVKDVLMRRTRVTAGSPVALWQGEDGLIYRSRKDAVHKRHPANPDRWRKRRCRLTP